MTTAQVQFTPQKTLPQGDRPIIFFDGDCVMCNTFVDLMLQLDRDAKIRLAPLQGETAQDFLPPLPDNRQEWTIYYLDETGLWERSEAVLRICKRLGGFLWPLSGLGAIALPVRDQLYTLIARNRYRLFGQRATCRTQTADEDDRFLP